MFRLLVEIFNREDLLQQAYNTSIKMLKTDAQMFTAAYKSLASEGVDDLNIYKLDKTINEDEREVRRKVVAHLATSTSRDIVFGLMLVSIIIDIERIGDYTKNIMDLAKEHPSRLDYYSFKDQICTIESDVEKRMAALIHGFEDSDEDVAQELMDKHKQINQMCDEVIKTLTTVCDPDIPSNEAVSLALYVRYLKRISSHITNVASGIVNTFDNIGFK